jgi:AcrR family transcriptional regulator
VFPADEWLARRRGEGEDLRMTVSVPTGPQRPRGRELREDDGRLLRGRRSRARILDAARELFRERGFDGATLRAIAARAEMGASSIYRHVRSKEELLVDDLAERQERAWSRFRGEDDASRSTLDRIHHFLAVQHALLARDPDLTTIALRATTHCEARVARRVLALHDRTIGLLAEVLQHGCVAGDIERDIDVFSAARVIHHITTSARIPWANGIISSERCHESIEVAVDLLFRGLASNAEPRADSPQR